MSGKFHDAATALEQGKEPTAMDLDAAIRLFFFAMCEYSLAHDPQNCTYTSDSLNTCIKRRSDTGTQKFEGKKTAESLRSLRERLPDYGSCKLQQYGNPDCNALIKKSLDELGNADPK